MEEFKEVQYQPTLLTDQLKVTIEDMQNPPGLFAKDREILRLTEIIHEVDATIDKIEESLFKIKVSISR